MITFERAGGSRRIGLWSVLGIILVPLVLAGGFLWATWDSDTRLGRVEAAVVNEDDPVTIDGQLVPLGRQLAGGLVDSDEDRNFSWVLTDAADATEGLTSGRYAAVVRIPEDFSARATSFSENDAAVAEPATIEVQTSEVSGIADPVVGQAITAAATKALNTELTEQYLDGIYVGFNQVAEEFEKVADAAGKLAGGTEQLSGGIARTATGAGQLADGLDGLDAGADELADGLGQLADGTAKLPDGTDQLADGTRRSADGASDLASGAKKLAGGTADLADGADDLAGGVKELKSGTAANAQGVEEFAGGLRTYSQQMAGFAELSDAQLAGIVPCPLPAEQCPVFYAGLRAGTTVAATGLTTESAGQPSLLDGADALADGAAGIDDGVGQLATGATKLAEGTEQLAQGTDDLAGGAGRLADGLDQLANGTRELADSTVPLAVGITRISDGADQLAVGTGQSAEGAGDLHTGLVRLADGADELAGGSRQLADGLAEGQQEIPTYTRSERERLSGVVATPVTAPEPEQAYADVATTTFLAVVALWVGGLASYLVLRAVSSRVLGSMKPSWRLALEGLAPGAAIATIQAVILTAILDRLLNLSANQVITLLPFAVLTGIAFAAVNHALVAWFGGAGRFVSVIIVVLAAAGAITSAVPELFEAITPFLPLTPALQGFRAITSDGSGAAGAAGLLLAWLLIGFSAAVLAVARRRMLPTSAGAPRLAESVT
jgi:putative membrane protein